MSTTNNVSTNGFVYQSNTNNISDTNLVSGIKSSETIQLGSLGMPQTTHYPISPNDIESILPISSLFSRPKDAEFCFIGRDSNGDILLVVDNPYKAEGYIPKVFINDNVEYSDTSDISDMPATNYPGIAIDAIINNPDGTVTVTLPSGRELTNVEIHSSTNLITTPFTNRNDAVISYASKKYSATLPKLANPEFYKVSLNPMINANQHVIRLNRSAFVNPNTITASLVVPETE